MKATIGKILSLVEIESVGLKLGWQYDTEFSQELKQVFVQYGYATEVTSDNYPKGIDTYEEKSYGKGMFVFKQNSAYKSNCVTSDTWVATEWDLILQGA